MPKSSSRSKRRRRASAPSSGAHETWAAVQQVVQRQVAKYSADGVAAALHAACSSPGAVHRLPSLTAVWVATQAAPPSGERETTARDVERWLSRLSDAVPSFAATEDALPLDPTVVVRVFHRGGLWPVHPGILERPLELIAALQRWGEAIDEQAVEQFGFGFADLLEVALRIIATEQRRTAALWNGDRAASVPAPISLAEGEIGAVHDLLNDWARSDTDDGFPGVLLEVTGGVAGRGDDLDVLYRLREAMEFATIDAREIAAAQPSTFISVSCLAVRSAGSRVPVPAGLVLSGLLGVSLRLLDQLAAAGANPQLRAHVLRALVRSGEKVLRDGLENLLAHALPVVVESGDARCWVVCPSARHVALVAVVAGLSSKELERAIERARLTLSRAARGAVMRCIGEPPSEVALPQPHRLPVEQSLLGGAGRVVPDAVITRVVLVEGPWAGAMRRHRGQVVLSVDEWRYITARTRDPEELWSFLEELSDLPSLDHVTSFDLRDLWIWFQAHGVLLPGGLRQRDWRVPSHDGHEDWATASVLDGVEEMLRGWGMGGLAAWPAHAVDENGVVSLWSLTLHARVVASPQFGFAVSVTSTGRRADHYFADLLVENIHTTLRTMAADGDAHGRGGWSAWCGAGAGRPVMVELVGMPPDPNREPARLAVLDSGDRIVLAYDESQLRYLPADQMHAWLGTALADAVAAMSAPHADGSRVIDRREVLRENPQAAASREAFLRTWLYIAPALRVFHHQGLSARATTVFAAARLTEQGRNRAGRSIAREVLRRKIPAQHATGEQAIALLSEICQAAVAALHTELAAFDGITAVQAAAEEVERIWEVRIRNESERAVREGLSARDHAREEVDESLTTRAGDFLLETLVHDTPAGANRLDHRDWIRLIHLATECIQLSTHLNAAQCGLLQVAVRLLPTGIVQLDYADTLLDVPLHQEHRAAANARWIASMIEERALDPEPDPGEDKPFQSMRAYLEHAVRHPDEPGDERRAALVLAVDDALLAELGTSLDAINAILATIAAWPVAGDPVALTASVSREVLVTSAARWSSLPIEQIESALPLLTLSAELLTAEGIKYWSLEGRNARLALRPIIATTDRHTVMLLPRRTVGTRRVLGNYHSDCRLPWPYTALPSAVRDALRAWRKAREHDFEAEVERLFHDEGIVHLRRALLPHKALKAGLVINGEIDLLAADPRCRVVWVVEAKDQHIPFDPYQIVSEVIDFHGLPSQSTLSVTARQAGPPEKAFVGKLLKKAEQVRGQLATALNLLGIPSEETEGWQVVPLIVTPRPCAAAAVAHPRVTFATTTDLDFILSAPRQSRNSVDAAVPAISRPAESPR